MRDNSQVSRNSKYRELFSDTLVFAIGKIGSKVILFFMMPLYTIYLSTEEYGISDLVFTVGQLIIPFVSVVIFDAILRFGLQKDTDRNSVLKNSFVVLLLGSIFTVCITPLFSFYLPLSQWKWYLCLYVIFTMVGSVQLNYLKVTDRNKAYAAISITQTAVLAVSSVLLVAHFHMGVRGYLISIILCSFTTVVLSSVAGKIPRSLFEGRTDKQLLREMLLFSAPLIINNVSWWVIHSSDKVMIEAMVGAAALGLYTAASKIPSLINVIISVFSQAWGISSVKEYESSNDNRFYSDIFVSYSAIGFGAAIIINTVAKPFMGVYVSDAFREAWRFVPLLIASAAFSAVASYFGSLYGALKKSINNMLSTLIAAAVNIAVNFIFIRLFGTWGAVIGTVAAYVLLAFYRMADVLRFIRFDPRWSVFLMNAFLTLIQAVLVSMDYHIYIVSSVCLVLFIVINRGTIVRIAKTVCGLVRKHR